MDGTQGYSNVNVSLLDAVTCLLLFLGNFVPFFSLVLKLHKQGLPLFRRGLGTPLHKQLVVLSPDIFYYNSLLFISCLGYPIHVC